MLPIDAATAAQRALALADPAELLDLARSLIEVESHKDHPDHELPLARLLTRLFANAGIEAWMSGAWQGRPNVLARWGPETQPALVFNGHLDTIPAYNMPAAFQPRVADGRLWGRGACDMKGALAAMAYALVCLKRTGAAPRRSLMFAGAMGEEEGNWGSHYLLLGGLEADAAIVGEATNLRIGTAHKGQGWFDLVVKGKATHSSVPEQGINAVVHASRLIVALEDQLQPVLAGRLHPLLGRSLLNVGVVAGGDQPNVVPGSCKVGCERRWLPGETLSSVVAELESVIAGLRSREPRFEAVVGLAQFSRTVPHPAMDLPLDSPVVRLLQEATRRALGAPRETYGVPYSCDAGLLTGGGVPSAVFGPGDIAQAHSDAEYISVDELWQAFQVYVHAACMACL